MGTTLAALKDVIRTNLGVGGRAVELTDADLTRGIAAALRRLGACLPERGWVVIPVSASVRKYLVDRPNVAGVVDVTFFNGGSRLVMYPYPDAAVDQAMMMAQIRELQLVWGDRPEWEWLFDTDPADADKEKCYVLTHFNADSFLDRTGRIPTHMAVEYLWYLAPTDDKKVGLPRVRHDVQDWVESYATAFCRQILGDVRGKFRGIPGPNDGESLPIDADQQLERASGELQKLTDELKARRRQLPLMID